MKPPAMPVDKTVSILRGSYTQWIAHFVEKFIKLNARAEKTRLPMLPMTDVSENGSEHISARYRPRAIVHIPIENGKINKPLKLT